MLGRWPGPGSVGRPARRCRRWRCRCRSRQGPGGGGHDRSGCGGEGLKRATAQGFVREDDHGATPAQAGTTRPGRIGGAAERATARAGPIIVSVTVAMFRASYRRRRGADAGSYPRMGGAVDRLTSAVTATVELPPRGRGRCARFLRRPPWWRATRVGRDDPKKDGALYSDGELPPRLRGRLRPPPPVRRVGGSNPRVGVDDHEIDNETPIPVELPAGGNDRWNEPVQKHPLDLPPRGRGRRAGQLRQRLGRGATPARAGGRSAGPWTSSYPRAGGDDHLTDQYRRS